MFESFDSSDSDDISEDLDDHIKKDNKKLKEIDFKNIGGVTVNI